MGRGPAGNAAGTVLGVGAKASLKVNYVEETWALARRAYVAQMDDLVASPTLLAWVLAAVDEHAARSPGHRARAAEGPTPTRGGRTGRVHRVDPQVLTLVDQCRAADRGWDRRRMLSRSAWVNEAVDVAARAIERERGPLPDVGVLPPGARGRGTS